jgi:hypothetical protein
MAACASLEEAVIDADIVVTATWATQPFLFRPMIACSHAAPEPSAERMSKSPGALIPRLSRSLDQLGFGDGRLERSVLAIRFLISIWRLPGRPIPIAGSGRP